MSTPVLRREFVEGLRALAQWVEDHPEIEVPYEASSSVAMNTFTIGAQSWNSETETEQDVAEVFAAMVKALGGSRTKDADDRYMRVTRQFGPGVALEVWATRDSVCEAVVLRTETVIEDEIVEPAVTRRVEKQRDIVEWRCAPLLADKVSV